MILLDTSAVILLLRGEPIPERHESETLGISAIVEMELLLGALHGGGRKEQRRVDSFLSDVAIFDFNRHAALETAKLLAHLWKLGKPIGDFDTQIAGHALALDLPLLTGNVKHFKRAKGLKVLAWNGD